MFESCVSESAAAVWRTACEHEAMVEKGLWEGLDPEAWAFRMQGFLEPVGGVGPWCPRQL